MPVFGVVALDEVLEVFAPERVCLEGEVLVRPKVVDPEPGHAFHDVRSKPRLLVSVGVMVHLP